MDFSTIDIAVFALYALIILSIGLFVSRQKKGETISAEDYFLAGKSLPLGCSLLQYFCMLCFGRTHELIPK